MCATVHCLGILGLSKLHPYTILLKKTMKILFFCDITKGRICIINFIAVTL